MDLLRSTIESFYFSMPLADLAYFVNNSAKQDELREYLVEIVNRKNPEFTVSEITLLGSMLDSNWMYDSHFNITPEKESFMNRLPLLLNSFSSLVLICNNQDNPKVQFNELLRWRQLTMLLGEDLFTLPFLANNDLKRNTKRCNFAWPNVLNHDNIRLNVVLKEILSDTHSHINAAMDVFEFNWICMMNSPQIVNCSKKEMQYLHSGATREYDLVHHYSPINMNLSQWIVMASYIRLMLFAEVYGTSSKFTEKRLRNALKDIVTIETGREDMENEVEQLLMKSLKLNMETGSCARYGFDYAIRFSDFIEPYCPQIHKDSPYIVHHGERKLLYKWFYGYYGGNIRLKRLAPFVLLYLVIKSKVRREYIQTNDLVGFRNFQIYQGRKDSFLCIKDNVKKNHYAEVAYRYAIQSSIGSDGHNYIEARLTPENIVTTRLMDYHAAIFEYGEGCETKSVDQVTYVIHLIKFYDGDKPDATNYRHYKAREKYWEYIKTIVEAFRRNNPDKYPNITGIDAASNELICRPEVLAPMFRYARHSGISRFTYHAGEDFYDIADGLRTIDELLNFMEYSMGDRIGHGLALGIDTRTFYACRHNVLLIPKQILLDNIVWLRYKAKEYSINLSADTELFIERTFNDIARELGYFNISTSMYEYYCSMKLRGNIIDEESAGIGPGLTDDIRYSVCSKAYRENDTVKMLHMHYEKNPECRQKGKIPVMPTIGISYGDDISLLQDAMLYDIENRGVVIETNPSSNLKIGRFNRYDEHPITRFNSVTPSPDKHSIMVSINTDDKGVFATSLKNEFSLIAIALKKQKDKRGNRLYSEGQIEEYLRRIAKYGNLSRFQ